MELKATLEYLPDVPLQNVLKVGRFSLVAPISGHVDVKDMLSMAFLVTVTGLGIGEKNYQCPLSICN